MKLPYIFILFLLAVNLCLQNSYATETQTGNSAGCLIRFHDSILLVRDVWTNKLSLPGGHRTKGEMPLDTAERETFEETGIIASADYLLDMHDGFRIFLCTPRNTTRFIGNSTRVPRTSSIEIKQIILVPINDLEVSDLRYPKQFNLLKNSFIKIHQLKPVLIKQQLTAIDSATIIQKISINTIQWMQQFDSTFLRAFFRLASFMAEMPIFFLVLTFFWLPHCGTKGPYFTAITLLSLLINVLLKYNFAEPRPFEILPQLNLTSASGYGFPSGHAQFATVFWGFIALQMKQYRVRTILACLLIVILVCISRLYLGVHFIHDIFIGVLIGASLLGVFNISKVRLNTFFSSASTFQKIIIYLLIFALPLYYIHNPEIISIASCCLGLLTGLIIFAKENFYNNASLTRSKKFIFYVVTLFGLFTITGIYKMLVPVGGDSITHIYPTTIYYYSLGLWLSSVRKIL